MRGSICVNDWTAAAFRSGAKTSIRRLVQVPSNCQFLGVEDGHFRFQGNQSVCPVYNSGDVLYVQETWRVGAAHRFECYARIEFKAGGPNNVIQFTRGNPLVKDQVGYDYFVQKWPVGDGRWISPVSMPKVAARTFLQVKSVKLEHLWGMTEEDFEAEGIRFWTKDGKLYKYFPADSEGDYPACAWADCPRSPQDAMKRIWDSYIRSREKDVCCPVTLQSYGWDANPWVQAIRFEKITKEEAFASEA